MAWKDLSKEDKKQFKNFCDKKFGKTSTYCENGEPMYFDSNNNLLHTEEIINLLFQKNKN